MVATSPREISPDPVESTAPRRRPPLWLEQRAILELAELFASPVYYGIGVPRGDGSPVLLLPGFLGSDDYLVVLRDWLRRVGYRPHPSGFNLCAGAFGELQAHVLRRTEAVAAATEQKVTLVGHSLGGILACMAAQRRPDLVAQVVTLGSARRTDMRGASHPMIRALADLLIWEGAPPSAEALERDGLGLPLPDGVGLTCIYSRDDAVVDWRACADSDTRTALVEVRGSHTGLAWNASVYRALGRCLLRARA